MAVSDPARILVMVEQPLIVEVIKLTLNHGVYVTRETQTVPEATVVLGDWHPHLAVIDMDIGGDLLLNRMAGGGDARPLNTPVLALTRRGDLRTKLAAFDQGVDDIMTIPFSPEELLARVLVITRRALGVAIPFDPILRLGELEIDILHRQVRAGSSELHLTGLEQSLLYLLAARAPGGHARRDPGCALGRGLRVREQRRGPPRPQPAGEAPERLAQATVHRDRAGAGLSVHPHLFGS